MRDNIFWKGLWLLRYRPIVFFRTLRGYLLFHRTHLLAMVFPLHKMGVTLGRNVRLQKLGCVSAEQPGAKIYIGENSIVYENAKIEAYGSGQLNIGQNCILGDVRIYSRSRVNIGDRFVCAWNVFIQDYDPHPIDPELRARQLEQMCEGFYPKLALGLLLKKRHVGAPDLKWTFPSDAIEIGNDVWIGANVTVLKGAKIGDGSIVASSAVVLGGVYPARSILAGNPAKVVKSM